MIQQERSLFDPPAEPDFCSAFGVNAQGLSTQANRLTPFACAGFKALDFESSRPVGHRQFQRFPANFVQAVSQTQLQLLELLMCRKI